MTHSGKRGIGILPLIPRAISGDGGLVKTGAGNLTLGGANDWVEHCTALVENLDGRIELLRFRETAAGLPASQLAPHHRTA